jgi:hypothetical protein
MFITIQFINKSQEHQHKIKNKKSASLKMTKIIISLKRRKHSRGSASILESTHNNRSKKYSHET